jgi:hypothetical protein
MGFSKLGDLLNHPSLPEVFRRRLKEAKAVSLWETAVGPTIAKYATAIRVEDGILWIEVGHPIWRSELHHRRRQILEILNQGLSGTDEVLKDLHFSDPKKSRKNQTSPAPTRAQTQSGTPSQADASEDSSDSGVNSVDSRDSEG